ncbi:MAG: Ada metal-binding domain-containing protein [Cyclobacteriaceae bacterium]
MRLRIFGKLNCQSGKRMKRNNRVFFQGQEEAIAAGFRPCGHCMKSDYQNWKDGLV